MTVKEIVQAYLKANGFDGLCYDKCGCDGSMPCGENVIDCKPAVIKPCEGCADAYHSCGELDGKCYVEKEGISNDS